jgi:hypothetical protein
VQHHIIKPLVQSSYTSSLASSRSFKASGPSLRSSSLAQRRGLKTIQPVSIQPRNGTNAVVRLW